MLEINPKDLPGGWEEGFALDFHTLSAVYTGDSASGHPQFDTTYSEVGKHLYRLKYGSDRSVISELAETASNFIKSRSWIIDLIVPVPPSKQRKFQPVTLLAEALGSLLGVDVCLDCIEKVKDTPELKDIHDFNERLAVLKGAFEVLSSKIEDKTIMLFDDLYRSGATLHTITDCLLESDRASTIYALTMTKTRTNR